MDIKSIKNQYPVYIPDQFLTSDNLNESFGFLECHGRATRSMIIGQGIIDGLEYAYVASGGKVKTVDIKSGYGSTKDGYLISLPEESAADKTLNYKNYIAWTIPARIFNPTAADDQTIPCIRLLTDAELRLPDLQSGKLFDFTETDLLSKYNLVAFAEIKATILGNCSPGTCNSKGEEDNINSIILLLEKSKFTSINMYFPEITSLQIDGLTGVSFITSKTNYFSTISDLIVKNLGLISAKMTAMANVAAGLIPYETALLKTAASRLTAIATIVSHGTNFSQYYLLFANDLQMAVNEFVLHYNNFIHKYYNTEMAPRFDRMLVLGQFPPVSADPYRYQWTSPLSSRDRRANYLILANLCKRMSVMVSHFTESADLETILSQNCGPDAPDRLRIIPDKGLLCNLGDRSVPFYYKVLVNGKELFNQSWRAQDMDNSTGLVFNYFDALSDDRKSLAYPFTLNLSGYPFYRLEGHLGLKTADVLDTLKSMLSGLDIPLQVISADVESQKWSGFKDKFAEFTKNYSQFYKDIVTIQYTGDPENQALHEGYIRKFKTMRTNVNDVSYRDLDTIKSIMNDVNAYGRMFSGASKRKKSAGVKGVQAAASGGLTKGQYTGQVAAKIKTTLSDNRILELRDDLVKFYPILFTETGYSLRDLKGLEYLGGAFKGGTIVLVSDGSVVIGDFSLPYFIEKI